jgi:hypothetical protein
MIGPERVDEEIAADASLAIDAQIREQEPALVAGEFMLYPARPKPNDERTAQLDPRPAG